MSTISRRHILNFHGIGPISKTLDPGEADVWIETRAFEQILDVLPRDESVAITFDDGNASDLEIALPALLRRGLLAEFFVNTDKLGLEGYLDVAQVKELAAAGVEIGSHGLAHRSWRGCDDAALRHELEGSRKVLEDILDKAVTHCACPLGAYDRRVLRGLKRAGYTRVYASDGGTARADARLQARTSLGPNDSPPSVRRPLATHPRGFDSLLRQIKTTIKRLR